MTNPLLKGSSPEVVRAYRRFGYLRDESFPDLPLDCSVQTENSSMEDRLYAKEILKLLENVFDDRAKDIVLLYYGYGWTDTELAEFFDVSRGRIQVLRNNFLFKMRLYLKRKCRELQTLESKTNRSSH